MSEKHDTHEALYNLILDISVEMVDSVTAELFLQGAMSVSTETRKHAVTITVLVGGDALDRVSALVTPYSAKVIRLEEKDWVNEWVKEYSGVSIGNFRILPPGRTCEHADGIVIELDPRDAFGAGTHPTTHICLRAIEEIAAEWGDRFSQSRVLDIGTGTGICAIAAEKLGAGRIDAFDLDPISVRKTQENVAHNDCRRVTVFESSVADFITDERYDLVIANLQTHLVQQYCMHMISIIAPRGALILSGIDQRWNAEMHDLFYANGITVQREYDLHEWKGYRVS